MAMEKYAVYHSLEEALNVLKRDEFASVPEIQKVLAVFSACSTNQFLNPVEDDEIELHQFIVIEGLDGSGKTTISKRLAKLVEGVRLSTPCDKLLCVRSFFDKQSNDLRRAYYSLSNYAVAMEIKEILKKQPVVLDRFWHSTAAYELAGQAKDIAHLPKAGDPIYMWPKDLQPYPDVVFFLKVTESERLRRLSRRTTTTVEEARLAEEAKFREVLHEAYRRMHTPNRPNKIVEMNASRPNVKAVARDLFEALPSFYE